MKSFARHEKSLMDYLEFFESLPLYYEDEKFIYVHGGLKQGVSLSHQRSEDMLWIRDEFYGCPYTTGKTIIFGHTPTYYINKTYQPTEIFNNYALDTGCVFGGYLSAVHISNGKISRIYQVAHKRVKKGAIIYYSGSIIALPSGQQGKILGWRIDHGQVAYETELSNGKAIGLRNTGNNITLIQGEEAILCLDCGYETIDRSEVICPACGTVLW